MYQKDSPKNVLLCFLMFFEAHIVHLSLLASLNRLENQTRASLQTF